MSVEEMKLYHIWTPEQTAEYLGIHVATLHKYRRDKLIGHIVIRGTVRFRKKDVIDFVRNHFVAAVAA